MKMNRITHVFRKGPTIYGAAGNLYQADRTPNKSGIIRFDGCVYQDDRLKSYAGERVRVEFDGASAFASSPIIVHDIVRRHKICTITETYMDVVDEGEWRYRNHIIQEQEHPKLLKYHVFRESGNQRTIGSCHTIEEARKMIDAEIKKSKSKQTP